MYLHEDLVPRGSPTASGRTRATSRGDGDASDRRRRIFTEAMESASESYGQLVEGLEAVLPAEQFDSATDRRKAIGQAARSVLPNATETKIFVTGNVRAWRHFIEMRATRYADWEICALALQVLDLLQREAPIMFGDFEVSELPDGTRVAAPEYSKV